MNQYLESARQRYELLSKGKKNFINPMSSDDCEIIEMINQIIEMKGLDILSEIMSHYKEVSDKDLLDQLTDYASSLLIDNSDEESENKEKKKKQDPPAFLIIQGERLFARNIFGYCAVDKVDDITGSGFRYGIQVNPTPPDSKKVPLYANHIFWFDDNEEYRNKVLLKIDEFIRHEGFRLLNYDE